MVRAALSLFTSAVCLSHDAGFLCPERPARLETLLAALDGWRDDFGASLTVSDGVDATREQLLRVHTAAHLDRLEAAFDKSGGLLNLPVGVGVDASVRAGSRAAAVRSAGLAVAAVDAVFGADGDFGAKTARRALVLARPPGHHAEPDAALGFCLYNNALVGVAHAQAAHGVGRCAILDFDVHQGNGNAAMCWDDPTRLYASTHERGIFPCGVSAYAETPNPSVLNRPLSAGAGSAEFRRAWTELLEAVDRFEPEAIFLSAGFDAHADEELASINLADDDYDWITRQAVALAGDRPVVSVLEGGYGLDVLARCTRVHLAALLDG